MQIPDTITIETSQRARVEAERADFYVTVAGAALFSGAQALQKAREVAELVAMLKNCGVEEAQIHIESVRVETASGTFSKSSSAHYALRVENIALARVADAVGAVASARNASLSRIEWRFAPEKPLRDGLREKCLDEALERARGMAAKLGVKLIGIYESRETWAGMESNNVRVRQTSVGYARSAGAVSEEALGMAVSHAEEVTMELMIKFRVSEFGS